MKSLRHTAIKKISLEEGLIRQKRSNKEHGIPFGSDAYTGGDFNRMGWEHRREHYERRVHIEKAIPTDAIKLAATLLSENLNTYISKK